jgi:hypothetical protein
LRHRVGNVAYIVFQKSASHAKAWWLATTNRWRTATIFVARPGLSSPVVSEDEKKQTDFHHNPLFCALSLSPPSPYETLRSEFKKATKPVNHHRLCLAL